MHEVESKCAISTIASPHQYAHKSANELWKLSSYRVSMSCSFHQVLVKLQSGRNLRERERVLKLSKVILILLKSMKGKK